MFKTINNGKMPTKENEFSSHIDLHASEDVVIGAGETVEIGLGVCIDIELLEDEPMLREDGIGDNLGFIEGEFSEDLLNNFLNSHYLQLTLKHELATKGLIQPAVQNIGLDFKGEIKITVHNSIISTKTDFNSDYPDLIGCDGSEYFTIKKGDKIAQITLIEHKSYLLGC